MNRLWRVTLWMLAWAGLMQWPAAWAGRKPVFSPERANFSVRWNDLILGYKIHLLFALPEETFTLEIMDADWKKNYMLQVSGGHSEKLSDRIWAWTLPAGVGLAEGMVIQQPSGERLILKTLIMVPAERLGNGRLAEAKIGEYPDPRSAPDETYEPPRGFARIEPDWVNMQVSPHFTLGQFLCPLPPDLPKYLVLDERLILKLEAILALANAQGYPCRTLCISSGFRTPAYNHALGNVPYSTHLWGRAADIRIDRDGDGQMDDLNRDGRVDSRDLRLLQNLVERMDDSGRYQDITGGLGVYERIGSQGPFLHVDVRGRRARWENLPASQAPRSKNHHPNHP